MAFIASYNNSFLIETRDGRFLIKSENPDLDNTEVVSVDEYYDYIRDD